MSKYSIPLLALWLLCCNFAIANAQTSRQALRECQKDLKVAVETIEDLRKALEHTRTLWKNRKLETDSLTSNLKQQLAKQNSITNLIAVNSDTLDAMVKDYQQKLDRVDKLYVDVLRKEGRPWFLNRKGLKGFFYGTLIGSSLGIIYMTAK